jgi:hypothetical protein
VATGDEDREFRRSRRSLRVCGVVFMALGLTEVMYHVLGPPSVTLVVAGCVQFVVGFLMALQPRFLLSRRDRDRLSRRDGPHHQKARSVAIASRALMRHRFLTVRRLVSPSDSGA